AGVSSRRGAPRRLRGADAPALTHMRPIGLEDILGRERYGAERDAIRRRIIAYKRTRRVAVGDRLSFLFEDRATVWYQTQEKLSAVQYVRFPLAAEARRRITAGAPLALAVAHPNYRVRALLPEAVRASLAADLVDPAAAEEALQRVRDGG